MDKHIKTQGTVRGYHIPRSNFSISRGTSSYPAVSIDGYLQLKASSLLNGKGLLASLTQNYHDFRNGLEEPD